ncbi:regulatory protein RecX [Desulfosarcina cetonica]|uniref:regulatory protein RecX n=1 Tax=Desulfosarcina cetonica TaxID=90730 RepID=UPI00155D9FF5|nr:regulatory protein RecX [Desulfosarcina cetonica]
MVNPPAIPSCDAPADAALARALRMLTRRDHTEQELGVKLRQKGFSHAVVAHVLKRCRELGYLNDARTAMLMADQLARRGYGPLRIRQTLTAKGLNDALIERALAPWTDAAGQVQAARAQLEKRRVRLDREPDPWKRRQIAYRFLAGRGFPAEVIQQVMDDLGE